ncbi:MAG TPA: LptF/LptG family permease, partial [Gemmatimonadales bacterium]|nr:LptF/LptG family permease [Gemmatimonadales bacterium]
MRLRLLDRYILRQTLAPFFFALAALTSILLLNQVARRLPKLVGKGLPWSVIGEVFGLTIPFIIVMTLPMALLLAILYAFTHLGADNEITAMKASGVSIRQMLAPALLAGAVMACLTFYVTDQIHPRSNARLKALISDIGRKKPTLELAEQAINPIPPSNLFLRAGRVDANSGRLKDVAIYDLGQVDSRRIIYADSGLIGYAPGGVDVRLRLWHGTIHETKAATPELFQVTDFEVNTIRVRDVGNELSRRSDDEVGRGEREMSVCELLTEVRTAEDQEQDAVRDRRSLGRNDLRRLLGLAAPPPAGAAPPRGPRGYCAVVGWLKGVLTPGTAEAQQGTQRPPRRRPPLLPPKEPAGRPTFTTDTAVLADRYREVQGTSLVLSNWTDIQAADSRVNGTRTRAATYLVEVHKKWAISAACLVFVLLGVPIALRFPRGGMGIVIGGGLLIFTIADVGLIAGESLGKRGVVPPAVAIWSTNVVLALLGLWGLKRVSRESGSTRGGDMGELLGALAAAVRRPFPRRRA